MLQVEFALFVWLFLPGGEIATGIEIGTYYTLEGEHGCAQARDSVKTENPEVASIAMCVERLK